MVALVLFAVVGLGGGPKTGPPVSNFIYIKGGLYKELLKKHQKLAPRNDSMVLTRCFSITNWGARFLKATGSPEVAL